jgi:cation diffusion facilitator CzcD-associated flavoprotein CzcO
MRSIYARLNRRYGTKFIGFDRQRLVSSTLTNATVISAVTPPRLMPDRTRRRHRPRVAIVGAGLGGLMAGYTLAHRCDVTIFEARERVGGRVWSKNKSSGVVEAGARADRLQSSALAGTGATVQARPFAVHARYVSGSARSTAGTRTISRNRRSSFHGRPIPGPEPAIPARRQAKSRVPARC